MTQRVLVISSTFPQWEGDSRGAFVRHHWEREVARGATVRVLAPDNVGVRGELDSPLQVVRVPYAPRRAMATLAGGHGVLENVRESWWRALLVPGFLRGHRRALDRELAAFAPDVLAAHFMVPGGWLAMRAAERAQVAPRCWLYGHGTDVDLVCSLPPTLRRRVRRDLLAADRVTLPSNEKLGRLVEAMGLGSVPQHFEVERMSHAVVLDDSEPGEPLPSLPEGPFALFLGRLIAQKGVDDLIRACADARVPLVIAGEGPLAPSLRRLARRVERRSGVPILFVGWVTGARKSALIRDAAVVCVPSRPVGWRGEGAPLVVAEAHAMGRPVLVSALPGMIELVESLGVDAEILPPGDWRRWARAVGQRVRRPA